MQAVTFTPLFPSLPSNSFRPSITAALNMCSQPRGAASPASSSSAAAPAAAAAEGDAAEFARLASRASKSPYLDVKLRAVNEGGFAAAGVIVFRRTRVTPVARGSAPAASIDLLMAREHRGARSGAGDKLAFLPCGERRLLTSSPVTVALEELNTTTGGQLDPSTVAAMRRRGGMPLVHWSARSQRALFVFEVTTDSDKSVDVNAAGLEGAKRLEWVSRDQLRSDSFMKREVHACAAVTLRNVFDAFGVLDKLEALFDCRNRFSKAPPPPPVLHSLVPAMSASAAVDVVAALRISVLAARFRSPPLPPAPEGWHLLRAATQLHASDVRKLQLKFSPDNVYTRLGHAPSRAEIAAAAAAARLVALLFDGDGSDGADAMEALRELDRLRCGGLIDSEALASSPSSTVACQMKPAPSNEDDLMPLRALGRVTCGECL